MIFFYVNYRRNKNNFLFSSLILCTNFLSTFNASCIQPAVSHMWNSLGSDGVENLSVLFTLFKESEAFGRKPVCLNIRQHLQSGLLPVLREPSGETKRMLCVRRILIFPLRLMSIMATASQAAGCRLPLPFDTTNAAPHWSNTSIILFFHFPPCSIMTDTQTLLQTSNLTACWDTR